MKTRTVVCTFGGGGGGGAGFQRASAKLGGEESDFRLVGSFDNDPYSCAVFKYLCGVEQTCIDARELTPGMMREMFGERAPFAFLGSPPCLPASGPVLTPDGARRIDSLRVGDLVLTHLGRWRRVAKIGCEPFAGIMYGFRVGGTVDFQEFTPEHPIYVRRFWRPVVDGRQQLTMGKPQFMKASKVRVGDLIGFPVGEEEPGCAQRFVDSFGDPTIVHASGAVHDGVRRRAATYRCGRRMVDLRKVATSADLWFLLGVYVGDGYRRASRNETIFCVGATDSDLAVKVREAASRLGLVVRESREGGARNVKLHVACKNLCMIANAFGNSCETKHIPPVLFGLETSLVRALIAGYRAADGSDRFQRVNGNGDRLPIWTISSVSLDLMRDTQRLLLRLGVFGSIHTNSVAREMVIEGRTIKAAHLWEISVQEKMVKRGNGTFIDGCVWVPVREVRKRAAAEPVWNIEVDEDNTFCVPMMATHNCVGYSKLLSNAKSKTKKYETFNGLALVNTKLILDTWPDDPPAFLLYENVPNITSRGRALLREIRKLLLAAGYVIQDGFHECRHVGNLAQRRKRWFMVARHPSKIPAFLYLPPHHPGQVCGDVLSELPMPGDPAGGPMHRLPEISALNWWRLWAIPAGGDWRDLLPDDGTPRRARFRRHHLEKWTEPSVTIGGSGSNGPCGVADPRGDGGPRFKGSLGVLRADEPAGAVTAEAYPSTGRFSIADKQSVLALNLGENAHHNLYAVHGAGDATGTITGATRPGNGAPSFADPRYGFDGALGVLGPEEPAPPVTARAGATTGRFSFAAPAPLDLEPQPGNAGRTYDKYAVVPWGAAAKTVHGATRVGSGAPSVAQPLSPNGFRERWGVLSPGGTAGTVTGNARHSTGPFSYAAPVPIDLVPRKKCFDKGYAVIDRDQQPSHAIAAHSSVGCGTYSITDRVPLDLAVHCEPHAGAYGVIPATAAAPTVIATSKIDAAAVAFADPKPVPPPFVVLSYDQARLVADGHVAAPFAIVDPARPDEPLAIVEDMQKPPFRWEETVTKRGKVKRSKVVVPLVLISADGTWHRPLTTLELGVLQGLPWQHAGGPLAFGGGATKQRRVIGNMIPMPVGEALGTQMLVAGLASDQGCLFFTGGGGGLWVSPEKAARLLRAGVRRVRQQDLAKVDPAEMVLLDDQAPPVRRGRPRAAPKRRPVPVVHAPAAVLQ